jgi:signal transduction histidine kinase
MRARLTLAFVLFMTLFMGTLSYAILLYSRKLEATQLAQNLERLARQYRADLGTGQRTPKSWHDFLAEEEHEWRSLGLTMLVLDHDGTVIARSSKGSDWPLYGNWLVETVRYHNDTLLIALPWHSSDKELRDLSYKLLALTVGVVLATALGSWMLVGRVLSPINKLSTQAERASTVNANLALEAPSDDAEVVGLVGTLNRMLSRLSQTVAARERFHSAASHELRTPLQGFSTLLEYGLSRPRTTAEWEEIARDAHIQSLRLSQLTTDLLALNQLEMATTSPPSEEVDAGDLIERTLQMLQPGLDQKHIEVDVSLDDDGEIMAPWNHLEMLIRNLLENAAKYTPDGGKIKVSWDPMPNGQAIFSLWNQADLPPGLDPSRLCEPFYRLDKARESSTGGNGLGLAICAAIANNNGWDLKLIKTDGGLLAELRVK